ncbi:hypothetical protein [Actinoplanes sp. TFC3]|uniref:hypothetical protein n=1 Tax=Actinoplanes sp. TFC3 TaxID=1710355 RepID=UPI00137A50C9|nr:hypothetical protein [Actinoplanes sp. TFC3]
MPALRGAFTGAAIAVGSGVALAVVAAVANDVPVMMNEVWLARADRSAGAQVAEFVSLILDSGWAWAALAVFAGWAVHRGLLAGALAGCVALLVATFVYDSLEAAFADGPVWGSVRHFWLLQSLLLGLPLGAIGALIRRPGPAGVLAALVVPVGAVLNMAVVPPPSESPVAALVTATVWVAAVAVTALILLRARFSERARTN